MLAGLQVKQITFLRTSVINVCANNGEDKGDRARPGGIEWGARFRPKFRGISHEQQTRRVRRRLLVWGDLAGCHWERRPCRLPLGLLFIHIYIFREPNAMGPSDRPRIPTSQHFQLRSSIAMRLLGRWPLTHKQMKTHKEYPERFQTRLVPLSCQCSLGYAKSKYPFNSFTLSSKTTSSLNLFWSQP